MPFARYRTPYISLPRNPSTMPGGFFLGREYCFSRGLGCGGWMLNVGSWQALPKSGCRAWPRSLLVIKTVAAYLCAQILPKNDNLAVSSLLEPSLHGFCGLESLLSPILVISGGNCTGVLQDPSAHIALITRQAPNLCLRRSNPCQEDSNCEWCARMAAKISSCSSFADQTPFCLLPHEKRSTTLCG